MTARAVMLVLWPAFLVAGVISAIVFAFVDPLEVTVLGVQPFEREYFYAVSFFFFWILTSLSSLITVLMLPNKSFLTDSDPQF